MQSKLNIPVHLTIDWRNKYTVVLSHALVIFGGWLELAWDWAHYFREGRFFRGVAAFGGSLLSEVYYSREVITW